MWSKNELTELGNFAKEYKGYQTGSNKYEDIIESHVNSPVLDTILEKFTEVVPQLAEWYENIKL